MSNREEHMSWFRDFSIPLWQIFGGNFLMLVTLVLYIAWWTILFRPNGNGNTAGAGLSLAAALVTGIASIAILSNGINSLAQAGKGFPLMYILLGAVAFYFISLVITIIAFRRILTSELMLITAWAGLELTLIAVLQASGRFGQGQVWTLVALIALSTTVGMVCYILHYRLDEISRFWNGLIPLVIDVGVVAIFLAVLALS